MAWMHNVLNALGSFPLATRDAVGFNNAYQPSPLDTLIQQCSFPELSCHNVTEMEDLCCFNAPGGTLLLTQFWDTNPPTGPDDSWTLHGLWPDNCDGTYEAYCDDSRKYRNITDILQQYSSSTLEFMRTYWKDYNGNDENFWQHEWSKHGTCVSTLEPSCFPNYKAGQEVPYFFSQAVELYKQLPSYKWLKQAGIVPSNTKTYSFQQIQSALSSKFEDYEVRLGCHYGELNEIWYFYNVRGSLQAGFFEPTDRIGSPSTCPRTGIKYLPKRQKSTTTSCKNGPTPPPQPPGNSFKGRGQLDVVRSGNTKGCIISQGAWYVSGTCATFTAERDPKDKDSFTLKSSKGPCAVINGAFVCGSVVRAIPFRADGKWLSFNGSTTFSTNNVPHGRRMERVFSDGDHNIRVQIAWR